MLTLQDVFNKIWQHFIIENKPFGYDKELSKCVYRKDDRRCAIGICIPDNIPISGKDNKHRIGTLLSNRKDISDLFGLTYKGDLSSNEQFVYELNSIQEIHDSMAINEDKIGMKNQLIDFAAQYNLVIC